MTDGAVIIRPDASPLTYRLTIDGTLADCLGWPARVVVTVLGPELTIRAATDDDTASRATWQAAGRMVTTVRGGGGLDNRARGKRPAVASGGAVVVRLA